MSPPARPAPRIRRAARSLALVLAALALSAELGSYAHLAAAHHRVCAEHGELVEVDARRAALALQTAPSVASLLATADDAPARHGHDHCLVCPLRRDRGQLPATRAAGAAALPPAAPGHAAPVIEHHLPVIALLLAAPKHSPPA